MKFSYFAFVLGFCSVAGFAQEERERSFRDFRGHELLAFNAVHLKQSNSVAATNPEPLVSVYPNPGSSLFIVTSDRSRTLTLFSDQGIALSTITLVEGKNELDLKGYLPGVYYLRESTDKVFAKIIVTK